MNEQLALVHLIYDENTKFLGEEVYSFSSYEFQI